MRFEKLEGVRGGLGELLGDPLPVGFGLEVTLGLPVCGGEGQGSESSNYGYVCECFCSFPHDYDRNALYFMYY
jgi:hypothetical protein